jgi:UDP-N-acetylmuramate dehydrogenase
MKINLQTEVDLSPFHTFGTRQIAKYLVKVSNLQELESALDFAAKARIPIQILGGGSNTLFKSDYLGLVIVVAFRGIDYDCPRNVLQISAGENWHDLVKYTLGRSLYGLENLALIPGSVGAAPVQNIGAYGVELRDFFFSLSAYDLEQRRIVEFDQADCEFGYRDSVFKREGLGKFLITKVSLKLYDEPRPVLGYPDLDGVNTDTDGVSENTSLEIYKRVCEVRRRKLPDPEILGNAGSYFKNPVIPLEHFSLLKQRYPEMPAFKSDTPNEIKLSAAWLTDFMRAKQKKIGGAAVYKGHSLVLINENNAHGEDVYLLGQEIKADVHNEFGVLLLEEVQII